MNYFSITLAHFHGLGCWSIRLLTRLLAPHMGYFLGGSLKYHLHLLDYSAFYSKWELQCPGSFEQLLL